MSRCNTPKDNPVAERFIRTFKEHKIDGRTFQEELFHQIEDNSKSQEYQKTFNLFVKSVNVKANKKSGNKSPEQHDIASSTASMLMVDPIYIRELIQNILGKIMIIDVNPSMNLEIKIRTLSAYLRLLLNRLKSLMKPPLIHMRIIWN